MNTNIYILAYIFALLTILVVLLLWLRMRRERSSPVTSFDTTVSYIDEATVSKIRKVQRSKGKSYAIMCDRDEWLQNRYKVVIEDAGIECKCVGRGYDIYEELLTTKCKLLVIDPMMLPGSITGLEAIFTIREVLKLNIPIIVLTNFISETLIKESFLIGADNYLIKTDVENEELINIFKKANSFLYTFNRFLRNII